MAPFMNCFRVTLLSTAVWYFPCAGQELWALEAQEADLGLDEQGSSVVLLQQAAPVLTFKPQVEGVGASRNESLASGGIDSGGAGGGARRNPLGVIRGLHTDMMTVFSGALQRLSWHYDVFNHDKKSIQPQHTLFNAAPGSEWVVLFGTTSVFLAFDFFVLQKFERSMKINILSLVFWIACGLAYNAYFLLRYDTQAATDWCLGYLFEWMLSMENLFAFHLVFKVYQTPEHLMHRALTFGIFGAVLLRMVFFVALGSLMHCFVWVRFVFGGILIWSGVEVARTDDDEDQDISSLYSVRALKWLCGSRLMEKYDESGKAFFMHDADGRICATMLFFVVLCLEFTDILFAVDSVSAKVAQIADQYIAYSSSILAIFSLRAMFFIIHDLVELFELLKYGLSCILIFIGAELMLANVVTISPATVCIILMAIFITCICGSVAKKKLLDKRARQESLSARSEKALAEAESVRG